MIACGSATLRSNRLKSTSTARLASISSVTPSASSMSSTDEAGPAAAAGAAAGKLKLLCLHGFLQNSNVFRMKIGSMRKGLKSRVEFVFQDAPFHAASTLTEHQVKELGGDSNGLTWFQWSDLGPDKRPSLAVKYSNWEDTYATLCSAMKTQQPDGIFGFSQGATATALFLAALQTAQRRGKDLDVPLPRFCIVCSGFLPRDPEYAALLEAAKVDVPSLFIMGASDTIIPLARSNALMDTFEHSTTDLFEHPGAHLVPTCTGEFKQTMAQFLDRFRSGGLASASAGSNLNSLDGEPAEGPEAEAVAVAVGSRM